MLSKKRSVLVVDDLPEVRMPVVIILRRLGFPVCEAADGFSALLEMRVRQPEILIASLQMPGMSGFELLSIVRRRYAKTLVIATSDTRLEESIQPRIPADAFHLKAIGPIHLIELAQRFSDGDAQLPERRCVPVWVAEEGRSIDGVNCIAMSCPECLRITSAPLNQGTSPFQKAVCSYCANLIPYALASTAASYASLACSEHECKSNSRASLGMYLH